MNKHQAVENTNRELWRERAGDFYSDSIFGPSSNSWSRLSCSWWPSTSSGPLNSFGRLLRCSRSLGNE